MKRFALVASLFALTACGEPPNNDGPFEVHLVHFSGRGGRALDANFSEEEHASLAKACGAADPVEIRVHTGRKLEKVLVPIIGGDEEANLEKARAQLEKLKTWTTSLEKPCVRIAYQQWLDYHARNEIQRAEQSLAYEREQRAVANSLPNPPAF